MESDGLLNKRTVTRKILAYTLPLNCKIKKLVGAIRDNNRIANFPHCLTTPLFWVVGVFQLYQRIVAIVNSLDQSFLKHF